jgi:hypothetical protein
MPGVDAIAYNAMRHPVLWTPGVDPKSARHWRRHGPAAVGRKRADRKFAGAVYGVGCHATPSWRGGDAAASRENGPQAIRRLLRVQSWVRCKVALAAGVYQYAAAYSPELPLSAHLRPFARAAEGSFKCLVVSAQRTLATVFNLSRRRSL